MKQIIPLLLMLLLFMASCANPGQANRDLPQDSSLPKAPPTIGYKVEAVYPHDSTYFTEGLEYFNNELWESSGGNMAESPYPSVIGVVNTKTGKNDPHVILDRRKYFAEGISFFQDKLYWLTLDNGVGFVYDATTFKQTGSFKIPSLEGKGWGLTHDEHHLILSDGTDRLYYLHPDSLKLVKHIKVSDQNGPVNNLNELEYVHGKIFANQWLTNWLLIIDPQTGYVLARIDLSTLQDDADKKLPVKRELNGIAYNATTNRFMITGKKWTEMYEISIDPLPAAQQ
ncbi:MAG: glutaminyl-peptide cyclotransferase [Chitinophagaceae bacterium]|nr:glutaminyl-peptide cyclotransferase [Chitinophagaceae bacterium]